MKNIDALDFDDFVPLKFLVDLTWFNDVQIMSFAVQVDPDPILRSAEELPIPGKFGNRRLSHSIWDNDIKIVRRSSRPKQEAGCTSDGCMGYIFEPVVDHASNIRLLAKL